MGLSLYQNVSLIEKTLTNRQLSGILFSGTFSYPEIFYHQKRPDGILTREYGAIIVKKEIAYPAKILFFQNI